MSILVLLAVVGEHFFFKSIEKVILYHEFRIEFKVLKTFSFEKSDISRKSRTTGNLLKEIAHAYWQVFPETFALILGISEDEMPGLIVLL